MTHAPEQFPGACFGIISSQFRIVEYLERKKKGGTTMQKKTAAAIALGALAGVGVGAAAVSCGVSKALTDLAMDRKIPGYSKYFNVAGKKADGRM